MAVRTDSIVLAWSPDFDAGPWGRSTLTDCETVGRVTDATRPMPEFAAGVRLAHGKTSGTYRTFLRHVGALQSWGRAQVMVRSDSPAGVSLRLWDGAHEWYWNGTAWAAPTQTSHWTTPADVAAHLGSFLGCDLAFTVRLDRAEAEAPSPVFAGIVTVARLLFAQVSSDPTRAASWTDDWLHRVLVRRTLDVVVVSGSDEFKTPTGGLARLNFIKGVGECPYDVQGVEAVYDLAADPRLLAPLAGTWSPSAKTWAPTAPFTPGKNYHVRFLFRPQVEHSADDDFFTDKLPAVVFESVRTRQHLSGVGSIAVTDAQAGLGTQVGVPDDFTFEVSTRVLAARTTDRDRIFDVLNRWLGASTVEVSPSTSLPIVIDLVGQPETVPVLGAHSDERISLSVRVQVWPGNEFEGRVADSGGFTADIQQQGG